MRQGIIGAVRAGGRFSLLWRLAATGRDCRPQTPFAAGGGNRTHTLLSGPDFESQAVAESTVSMGQSSPKLSDHSSTGKRVLAAGYSIRCAGALERFWDSG